MSEAHLEDLRARARYAGERHALYLAKTYGPRPTSAKRLRELRRESDAAQARLLAAEAEAARAGGLPARVAATPAAGASDGV